MRLLVPLLALSALAPAQAGQREIPDSESFYFGNTKLGVAPNEKRALIIGKALWQAGAGKEAGDMESFTVRRIGDAWLLGAHYSGPGEVLDGSAFLAFDSFDGGVFYWSAIHPPKDEQVLKALKRRRAAVRLSR